MSDVATLKLTIDVLPDGRMRVIADGPGGETSGDLVLPTDPLFHEACARLTASRATQTDLEHIGRQLFAALFAPPLDSIYSQTHVDQRLRLVLSLPRAATSVAALPWEYLHHPERGPLLLRGVTLMRSLRQAVPPSPLQVELPLKVLLTAAQTPPQADVLRELKAAREALTRLGTQVQMTVEPHLTAAKLREHLRDGYHIWHFVGHGSVDDGASLTFEDEDGDKAPTDVRALTSTLVGSGVRLVLLSACEAGAVVGEALQGIAPAMVAADVPAVVAMQFSVAVESTRAFTTEFYRALARAWPIDACVAEGRKALVELAPERPDWGIPVIYTRVPDGILFRFGGDITAAGTSREQRLRALLHDHRSLNRSRLESFVGRVDELAASLGCTTNSYSSINPSSANASGGVTPPTNSPFPGSCLSC